MPGHAFVRKIDEIFRQRAYRNFLVFCSQGKSNDLTVTVSHKNQHEINLIIMACETKQTGLSQNSCYALMLDCMLRARSISLASGGVIWISNERFNSSLL